MAAFRHRQVNMEAKWGAREWRLDLQVQKAPC